MEKITGGLVPDKMYGKTRENWAERNAWIAENRVGSQGENNGKTSLSNNINNVFNIEGITDPEEVARKVLEKQNETMDMFQGSMDS
jgi:predicted Rdx family selenoprotein